MPVSSRIRLVVAVAALGAHASAPSSVAAADGPAIRVDVGFNGLVRPGRWSGVAITLENTGPATSGDLVVEIGGARAVAPTDVPSPSRRRVEIYVRIPTNADPVASVTFGAAAPIRVPLRFAADEAPVRICVGRGADGCAATIDPVAAPQSWRGYDAADEVIVDDAATLSQQQLTAYERWRVMRHWSVSTGMVPPPAEPIAVTAASPVKLTLIIYLGLLAIMFVAAPLVRVRPGWYHGAIVLIVIAASTAVLADGRFGAGAAVVVHDTTVVRGSAGSAESSISTRGVAWFPAASHHEIGTPLEDASIDTSGGPSFAKGQKLPFEVEGFTARAFIVSTFDSGRLTLTNVSPFTLHGCSMPEGYEPRTLPPIAAGERVAVVPSAGTQDPVLTCRIDGALDTVRLSGASIRRTSMATLLYDLRPLEERR